MNIDSVIIDRLVNHACDSFDIFGLVLTYDPDSFEVFLSNIFETSEIDRIKDEYHISDGDTLLMYFDLFNDRCKEVQVFLEEHSGMPRDCFIDDLKKLYLN